MILVSVFNFEIYTFNSNISDAIRKQASMSGVAIKEFNIIYKLVDDLREELSQKMPPVDVDYQVGKGTVLDEFLIRFCDFLAR